MNKFLCFAACMTAVVLMSACDPEGPSLSGTVTLDGQGFEGVTVTLTGEATDKVTTTGADGSYVFTELPPGRVRITPSREGKYKFEDKWKNRTVQDANLSGVDFTTVEAYPTWTVMVQFGVDNDLDGGTLGWGANARNMVESYLQALEDVVSQNLDAVANDAAGRINVLVLMDGNEVRTDGTYHLTGVDFGQEVPEAGSPGEVDNGNLQESMDFVNWAVGNYPADKYIYSIYTHGDGYLGMGGDDHSEEGDTRFSLAELESLTRRIKVLTGFELDLFWPFSCLMGTVELAYEVRQNANYVLFSEFPFPWGFRSFEALDEITRTPHIAAEEVGIALLDSIEEYYRDPDVPDEWKGYGFFTLSLVDLMKMDALYESLDEFGFAGKTVIEEEPAKADVFYALHADYELDYPTGGSGPFDLGYYFHSLLDRYSDLIAEIGEATENDLGLVIHAGSALQDYNRSIVHTTYCNGIATIDLGNYTGMRALFTEHPPYTSYQGLVEFGSSRWVEFVETMHAHRTD